MSSRESRNPIQEWRTTLKLTAVEPTKKNKLHAAKMHSSPPEDLIGAEKLFAEARFGRFNGPLKLGAFRTDDVVGWRSLSGLANFKLEHLKVAKERRIRNLKQQLAK